MYAGEGMDAEVGDHVSSRGHCDSMRQTATREQPGIEGGHHYTDTHLHMDLNIASTHAQLYTHSASEIRVGS